MDEQYVFPSFHQPDIFNIWQILSYGSDPDHSSGQGDADDTNQSYSLAFSGNYLETLSQSLIFSGSQSDSSDGDSDSKSVNLRTSADLYTGWSMNIDLSLLA